jgi:hypothetical protein
MDANASQMPMKLRISCSRILIIETHNATEASLLSSSSGWPPVGQLDLLPCQALAWCMENEIHLLSREDPGRASPFIEIGHCYSYSLTS